MILNSLTFKNWRCFFGEQTIDFATQPDKAITIVYAENGFGKTTLLNGLMWCLYGTTTAKFERAKKAKTLVNTKASYDHGIKSASVEASITDNGIEYIIHRIVTLDDEQNRGKIKIARLNQGSMEPVTTDSNEFVNSLMPEEMAPHFFYDGEYAAQFSSEGNDKEVKSAVQNILGSSNIKQLIEDLKKVAREYKVSIPVTNNEQEKLKQSMSNFNIALDDANRRKEDDETKLRTLTTQIEDLDKSLQSSNSADVKELANNREKLQKTIDLLKNDIEGLSQKETRWLSEFGQAVVSKRLTEEAFDFLNLEETKGKLPTDYQTKFIEDLLEKLECICGQKLEKDSPQYKKIEAMLDDGGDKTQIDRAIKVQVALKGLKEKADKAPNELLQRKLDIHKARERLAVAEQDLSGIATKLKNVNTDDIKEKETRRSELVREVDQTNRRLGGLESEIKERTNALQKAEREFNNQASKDIQSKRFLRRATTTTELCDFFTNKLGEEENLAVSVLRSSVKKILDEFSYYNRKFEITDKYELQFLDERGAPQARSTGENVLLSLAFTAALIQFSRERQRAETRFLLRGTIAPLVLDSPFGTLDPTYRNAVAQFLPNMTEQIILLVSESQGPTELLDNFRGKIGAEYILVLHQPEPPETSDEREKPRLTPRMLYNKEYLRLVTNSEQQGTEIMEVLRNA